MKMTMRYAHLSPAFLSAEVSLLDPPPVSDRPKKGKHTKVAGKRTATSNDSASLSEGPDLPTNVASLPDSSQGRSAKLHSETNLLRCTVNLSFWPDVGR